jgi:hypothetical protein
MGIDSRYVSKVFFICLSELDSNLCSFCSISLSTTQAFMEEMRRALAVGDKNNPTKASVESVLPGVHQQFTNLHHEINRVKLGIDDLGTRLEGMTLETRGLLENFGREFTDNMRRTLARNLVSVAAGLVGETVNVTTGSPRSPARSVQSPLRHMESTATTTMGDTNDDEMPLRPELKNRYRPSSATSIYHEYYGLGEFENVPIAASISEKLWIVLNSPKISG